METRNQTSVILLTAGAFAAFFVFGFSDNLKGAALPALLQDLRIDYARGGTILMGTYLGFSAASLSTGFLAEAFGLKSVLMLAGACLVMGVLCFGLASTTALLAASMVLLGFGLGALELGCNTLIVLLHRANPGRYLNLMAVMHGLGSLIAPLYAGWVLAAGQSWRSVYHWSLALSGALLAYFTIMRFPRPAGAGRQRIALGQVREVALSPRMLLAYFTVVSYLALEIGLSAWLVEYLQQVRGYDVTGSTQALALFFGLLMLGRLASSFFVDRIGYLRAVLWAALAASTCIAGGLFGPAGLVWLLPTSGLFLSLIFPTLTAAVSSQVSRNTSVILGLLFMFAGVGGMLGPWLIGVASELGGIRFGFSLNVAFGLATAAGTLALLRQAPSAERLADTGKAPSEM